MLSNRARLEQLNDRQRQCLRLVYANYEAKEIAAKLGISPHTVNEHLREARRIFGVSSSMHVARLLHEFEQDNRLVSEPFGVERRGDPSEGLLATGPRPGLVVRSRLNLTVLQRIGLIVVIALAAVALAGALLVGSEAITRIFLGYGIDISDAPYR